MEAYVEIVLENNFLALWTKYNSLKHKKQFSKTENTS